MSQSEPTADELDELRDQVTYLQQALAAVGGSGVDAVVIGGPDSEQIYTVSGADRPYRVLVENMGEAAATVSEGGVVLYANARFAEVLGADGAIISGRDLADYVPRRAAPAADHAAGVALRGDQATRDHPPRRPTERRCPTCSRSPTSTSARTTSWCAACS